MARDEQIFRQIFAINHQQASLWMMLWYQAHHGNGALSWAEIATMYESIEWDKGAGDEAIIGLEQWDLVVREPDCIFVRWMPPAEEQDWFQAPGEAKADVTLYRTSHIPALQTQFPITTPSAGVHFYATSMEEAIQLAMYLAPIQPKSDQTNIFPEEAPAPKRKTKRKGAKNAEERVVVQVVGDYWRQRMGYMKLKITDTRVDLILARYRAGYSVKQMKSVIDWVATDDWMRGRAAKSTRKFDDFTNFMDTNSKFEKYLHLAITQKPSSLDSTLKASDATVRVERMK